MNIIQALGSSSPVERVANFVKSMIQKQITETVLPRSRGHPDIVLNNDIQTN